MWINFFHTLSEATKPIRLVSVRPYIASNIITSFPLPANPSLLVSSFLPSHSPFLLFAYPFLVCPKRERYDEHNNSDHDWHQGIHDIREEKRRSLPGRTDDGLGSSALSLSFSLSSSSTFLFFLARLTKKEEVGFLEKKVSIVSSNFLVRWKCVKC